MDLNTKVRFYLFPVYFFSREIAFFETGKKKILQVHLNTNIFHGGQGGIFISGKSCPFFCYFVTQIKSDI